MLARGTASLQEAEPLLPAADHGHLQLHPQGLRETWYGACMGVETFLSRNTDTE